jgi:glycosyltransferase involved in cell wall biosynthesis
MFEARGQTGEKSRGLASGDTPPVRTLSVVVPVYCNQDSLPLLFDRLRDVEARLRGTGVSLELIFVDDGSTDDSLARLLDIKASRPSTRVIKLSRNFGEFRASKCGIQFVTGDCFSILAADLQDPPELLVEMAARWRDGAKFVVCIRDGRRDPWLSKAASALYYRMVRLFVIPEYPYGGFDLALMDQAFLPFLRDSSKNAPIPLLAFSLGFAPVKLSYHREQRKHGTSKWTLAKKVSSFFDAMLGFSTKPIRVVSAAGVTVAMASLVVAVYTVIDTLAAGAVVPGWASIVALTSFMFGVVIVMLGVIGEYLSRILSEVNKQPEVVIDRIY